MHATAIITANTGRRQLPDDKAIGAWIGRSDGTEAVRLGDADVVWTGFGGALYGDEVISDSGEFGGIAETETTGPPSVLRVEDKVLRTGVPETIAFVSIDPFVAGTVILSVVARRRRNKTDTETIPGSMLSAAAISIAICCAFSGDKSFFKRISNVTVVFTAC